MIDRVLQAADWNDLLGLNGARFCLCSRLFRLLEWRD